jgi:hypothetical protein
MVLRMDDGLVISNSLNLTIYYIWPVREYYNPDIDGDSIASVNDNCPVIYNPDQADDDNDGIGNECNVEYLRAARIQV